MPGKSFFVGLYFALFVLGALIVNGQVLRAAGKKRFDGQFFALREKKCERLISRGELRGVRFIGRTGRELPFDVRFSR